jgi:uncharacterized MAPEG superfamily protein
VTLAEWCLFGAVILYLGTLAPAKALAPREFDNADPRAAKFYEHPVRKRALGAHVNGIETFPFFAAAVILAELKGAPQDWTDALAVAFLLARIAFVIAYVGDRPTLRTVLWNVAMAFNVGIFFLSGYGEQGAVIATCIGLAWAFALWPLLARLSAKAPGAK